MVVRFEHMWVAIPMNLIAIMFVLFLMAITKLWMFSAPKFERHIPAYSLQVMKALPPDKPIVKKVFNPYAGVSKVQYDASGKTVPHHSVSAASRPATGFHNAPHKPGGGGYNYGQTAAAYGSKPPRF